MTNKIENNTIQNQECKNLILDILTKIEELDIPHKKIYDSKEFFDYLGIDYIKAMQIFHDEGLITVNGLPTKKSVDSGTFTGDYLKKPTKCKTIYQSFINKLKNIFLIPH